MKINKIIFIFFNIIATNSTKSIAWDFGGFIFKNKIATYLDNASCVKQTEIKISNYFTPWLCFFKVLLQKITNENHSLSEFYVSLQES